MSSYGWIAPLNGTLNSIAALLLLAGFVFIKRGQVRAHRACMIAAFSVSTIFLASYLFYHYQVGDVRFAGQGWVRPAYFTMLISHIALAAAILPLAIITLSRALRGALRGPSPNRALDLADLDLRIGHRRAGLRDGVPDLRPAAAALRSAGGRNDPPLIRAPEGPRR